MFNVSTALIHAVQQKQAAVCAYLVEKGADLTATDIDGQYAYKLLTLKFCKDGRNCKFMSLRACMLSIQNCFLKS